MELLELIRKRRSIRQYQDKPIPKDVLEKIVDAARFAATARDVQPWQFIVITEKLSLGRLAELADHGKFITQARACIAVFCEDTKYYLEDGCAATQNILLAATAFGVGSCWVAGDKKPYCPQVADLLNVPDKFRLVSLVSLGYPISVSEFKIASKKALAELLHWEKF